MATPEKGKRAIIKDRNSWGKPRCLPFPSALTVPSWRGNQHPREDGTWKVWEKSPANCHFQPSGSSMQMVWWTLFKSSFKVLISLTQRTESCLGSFPKLGLSHSSLVAYWLFLWSLCPGHGCLPLSCSSCSAVATIILQGKCLVPVWTGLSQHHPNTLSTEDPFQTHWEKSLLLPSLWLRALLPVTCTEMRVGLTEGAEVLSHLH